MSSSPYLGAPPPVSSPSPLLSAISKAAAAPQAGKVTWVLPLRHRTNRDIKSALGAALSDRVRFGGTPFTVVLAGPAQEVAALGELILSLDDDPTGG